MELIQKSTRGKKLVERYRGKSKLEDAPNLNITNIPIESDSEDENNNEFSMNNATDDDMDIDEISDEDNEWETVSIEHDSDCNVGSTVYDVDIDSQDYKLCNLINNLNETRMDMEAIYNSRDE